MTLANYEWNALMSMFATVKNGEDAKALFEMWLAEKAAEVYQEAWHDFKIEYEIDDDFYADEDEGEDYVTGADW